MSANGRWENRESGLSPERARHCIRGVRAHDATGNCSREGECDTSIRESGDRPRGVSSCPWNRWPSTEQTQMSLKPDANASRPYPPTSSHTPSNHAWSLESYGIEAVAQGDRRGRARDLFWLWMAANLGIIAVVYGAVMASLGLDPLQAILVGAAASIASFLPVGALSVLGKAHGEPMLALSRRVFGTRANQGPALASWLSLVGWETITAVVATEAILGLLGNSVAADQRALAAALILAAIVAMSLLASRLGHATIIVIQRAIAWLFGLATLGVAALLVTRISPLPSHLAHGAPIGAMVAAAAVIAASGGLSWVNVSADYSRYLPRSERSWVVIAFTSLGAGLPFAALVILGYFLARTVTSLAGTADPIGAMRSLLPGWLAIPYLAVAVAGLVAQMILGLYSSGLSLLALGIRLPRSRTVAIDATIVIVAGAWMVASTGSLFSTLVGLVELLAVPITAWAAIFGIGAALRTIGGGSRTSENRMGPIALWGWVLGSALGLAATSSSIYVGPLAKGFIGESGLGFAFGALSAAVFYALAVVLTRGRRVLSAS